MRPFLRSRDQLVQVAHHLAAVAGAKRERVVTLEECLELVAGARVEQDRFCPALACPQHVTIGKSAAGCKSLVVPQAGTPGDDVAHVHVHRGEARAVERRGHFHLAVHTLLAQDCHLRARSALDERSSDVLGRVESKPGVQARIVPFHVALEFLSRAIRVVAQALQVITRLRPGAAQLDTRGIENIPATRRDSQAVLVIESADDMKAIPQAGDIECGTHRFQIGLARLDDRSQLLVEQELVRGFSAEGPVERERNAGATGKHHLAHRRDQTAIGAIVVRQ